MKNIKIYDIIKVSRKKVGDYMKKKINIFTFLIVFFIFVNVFNIQTTFARQVIMTDAGGGGTTSSTTSELDKYKPNVLTTDDAQLVTDKVGIVLGAIRNISVVVSVIALMIIGLKYIFGSVEEKANYKATWVPYVIGFVLAIAGTTLVDFIYNMVH